MTGFRPTPESPGQFTEVFAASPTYGPGSIVIVSPTDPGSVGAGKVWVDTSGLPAAHASIWVRNTDNDDWDQIEGATPTAPDLAQVLASGNDANAQNIINLEELHAFKVFVEGAGGYLWAQGIADTSGVFGVPGYVLTMVDQTTGENVWAIMDLATVLTAGADGDGFDIENLATVSMTGIADGGGDTGDAGQVPVADGAGGWGWDDPTLYPDAAIEFVIDGGGSTITTGVKGDIVVPFDCTIVSATLLADQSGAIVVNVWKDTYANYPPTVADKITASAPPTITASGVKSQDATLTGWTTALAKGDTLRFNVDSVTSIQRVTLSLQVTR